MKIKEKCRICGISCVMPLKWWIRWKISKKRKEKPTCIGCYKNV